LRAEFVVSEILTGLRRNLTLTIAVIITTAVSLAILGVGFLIGRQVSLTNGFFVGKLEVVIYFDKNVTAQQKDAIGAQLTPDKTPEVKEFEFETKEEACANFRKYFANQKGLLENLQCDTLPESYRLKLVKQNQFDIVASKFEKLPGVASVINQERLLDRFFKLMKAIQFGAYFLAGLMLVSAALLIVNTIRVAAFSRRRETGIMRLVGASNLYVQLPFLLEGVVAGVVGTLFAFGIVCLFKWVLIDGLIRKAISSGLTPFIGWDAVWGTLPYLLVIGVGLAGLASFLTLRRHLRV
jgi:cell division transport system permease protein